MRGTLLLLLLAALPAGCDSPSDGSGEEGDICIATGNKCATPACSQYPTTPGCNYVDPANQHCPVERPQCFDPSKNSAYCDPMKAVCAKQKSPLPVTCPQMLCTVGDVGQCNDLSDSVFCVGGYACTNFGCGVDGGAGDGGGADMVAMSDLSLVDQ